VVVLGVQKIIFPISRFLSYPIRKTMNLFKRDGFYVGDYWVHIHPAKNFTRRGTNYSQLPNNCQYGFNLYNGSIFFCDCVITIGDVEAGTFRLNPKQEYFIERPVTQSSKFTFVLEDNNVNNQNSDRENNVIGSTVKIKFLPQKVYNYNRGGRGSSNTYSVQSSQESFGTTQMESKMQDEVEHIEEDQEHLEEDILGKTVYTGFSNQNFYTTDLIEVDEDNASEITILLIGKK